MTPAQHDILAKLQNGWKLFINGGNDVILRNGHDVEIWASPVIGLVKDGVLRIENGEFVINEKQMDVK